MPALLETIRGQIDGPGRRSAAWMFGLLCLIGAARMVVFQSGQIRLLEEAAHADLYNLGTAQEFLKTGRIYPELANNALPSQYNPMLYCFIALPTRLFPTENRYLPARVLELLVFAGCLALLGSIARKLVPSRLAMPLTMVFALSYEALWPSPGTLRGDFPAIFCSLAAMRLLLARDRRLVIAAGLLAGFETQFKVTMVTAAVSGFLWLAWRRDWRALAQFSAGALVTSAGIYGIFYVREPHMVDHFRMAFGTPLVDVKGAIEILKSVLREPVFLLSLAMLPVALLRWPGRFLLPAIYFVVSFAIASATVVQIGASTNYFYEAMFAVAPLGFFGWLHLRWKTAPVAALFAGLLLFTVYVLPAARALPGVVKGATSGVSKRNRDGIALRGALQGKHVLSMVLNAANFAPEVVLTEPWLLAVLDRVKVMSSVPMAKRVEGREFDLVIVPVEAANWRGLPVITPAIRAAIQDSYQPHCRLGPWLFLLPKGAPRDEEFAAHLDGIGVVRVTCPADRECASW
ncbi:MAG: hypothetical protein ABSB88_22660 [Bryobacteraceae bacterium]|jgi:hypothetical protein